ncbi:hypothetical protein [Rhizobacter sp. P5_C2]
MDIQITNWPPQPSAPEYCLLWIQHWSTCMTKAEWSGWFQTIGAVVAIVASIGIVRWQQRHEERRTLQTKFGEDAKAIGEMSGALAHFIAAAGNCLDTVAAGRDFSQDAFEKMTYAYKVVEEIQGTQAPDAGLKAKWIAAQETAGRARDAVQSLYQLKIASFAPDESLEYGQAALKRLTEVLDGLHALFLTYENIVESLRRGRLTA